MLYFRQILLPRAELATVAAYCDLSYRSAAHNHYYHHYNPHNHLSLAWLYSLLPPMGPT